MAHKESAKTSKTTEFKLTEQLRRLKKKGARERTRRINVRLDQYYGALAQQLELAAVATSIDIEAAGSVKGLRLITLIDPASLDIDVTDIHEWNHHSTVITGAAVQIAAATRYDIALVPELYTLAVRVHNNLPSYIQEGGEGEQWMAIEPGLLIDTHMALKIDHETLAGNEFTTETVLQFTEEFFMNPILEWLESLSTAKRGVDGFEA